MIQAPKRRCETRKREDEHSTYTAPIYGAHIYFMATNMHGNCTIDVPVASAPHPNRVATPHRTINYTIEQTKTIPFTFSCGRGEDWRAQSDWIACILAAGIFFRFPLSSNNLRTGHISIADTSTWLAIQAYPSQTTNTANVLGGEGGG